MSEPAANITLGLSGIAAEAPDRLALIFGGRRVTFAQLDQAISQAAAVFAGHGVGRGDVLPLLLTDQIALAVGLLGAMRMGATAMPLSPVLTADQRTDLIRQVGARFQAVSDPASAEPNIHAIPFRLTQLPPGDHRRLTDARPAGPCEIIVGSGSTGYPLLLPVSHEAMYYRNINQARGFGFQPGERFMLASPVFFASAIVWLIATLTNGVTCIFRDGRRSYRDNVEAAKPDYLHLTVLHAHGLLAEARDQTGFDLSGLKQLSVGASMVSESLRAELRSTFRTRLAVVYGTNETATVTIALDGDLRTVADTVGRPLTFAELAIVDSAGRPLGPGKVGHIRIKGRGNIDHYVGGAAPERFRDGWFHPGDLGRWEDGQLVHCGRSDQMMIMDGVNIYPAEIERALEKHPAIADVAAFATADVVHGQVPGCAVSLRSGAELSPGELADFAKAALSIKRPRHILVVDELPRNPQGKLIRAELERHMREAADRKPAQTRGSR